MVEQILLYDPLARFGCELPTPLDYVEAALRDSVVLSRFDLIEVTENLLEIGDVRVFGQLVDGHGGGEWRGNRVVGGDGMSWSRRLALPGRSPKRITCCETARRNHAYPVRSQTPVFGWYTNDGRRPAGLVALASRRAWMQPRRW